MSQSIFSSINLPLTFNFSDPDTAITEISHNLPIFRVLSYLLVIALKLYATKQKQPKHHLNEQINCLSLKPNLTPPIKMIFLTPQWHCD